MRIYDYSKEIYESMLTHDTVSLISQINEYKGKQNFYVSQNINTVKSYTNKAMINSIYSSNKIEGIYTSSDRLKKIALSKINPQNHNEYEIAGYRDILQMINENYKYIDITSSYILQFHRDLYKYSGTTKAGKYKTSDNLIIEKTSMGENITRFIPVAAWQTQEAIELLCKSYNDAINTTDFNPLILIPMFILDFLCIHPFLDGNGRISRILTSLLLYKYDYHICRYISIEEITEKTKETYYETLQASSINWHENKNDYLPFIKYLLGVILQAYRLFDDNIINNKKFKQDNIEDVIKKFYGKFTKADILKQCDNTSQISIQRVLSKLLKEEKITKLSNGKYASYIWNKEKD